MYEGKHERCNTLIPFFFLCFILLCVLVGRYYILSDLRGDILLFCVYTRMRNFLVDQIFFYLFLFLFVHKEAIKKWYHSSFIIIVHWFYSA